MVTDALGGHIELAIGSAAVIAPHVRSGKLRGIAVTGQNRSSAMPEVATLVEQGYPNLNAYAWWGIYAPAGLPKVILEKFHAEVVKAFRAPDVVQLMQDQLGMQLVLNTPEEMQKFVNIEMLRWSNVIKENGIKLD